MKIIYCHHASRNRGNPPSKDDGLKEIGKQDAEIVSRFFLSDKNKGVNFKAIYTSPFRRCAETAEIINKYLNIPVVKDERLNEFNKDESWLDLQKRVRNCLKDIVYKFEEEDTVICVTSGVNVVAFMSLAYKLKPNKNAPFVGVESCSPMMFTITKNNF